jgi:hypothetical protein
MDLHTNVVLQLESLPVSELTCTEIPTAVAGNCDADEKQEYAMIVAHLSRDGSGKCLGCINCAIKGINFERGMHPINAASE